MGFKYDVALSFAGEDRDYVVKVAEILDALGLKVFYDEFNEVETWGKNLYDEFDDIYQRNSKYCVMFISTHYKQKAWANHERQSAQARALIETEYILPVRFDDTEINGLRHTVGFIDANKNTPNELAYKIAKKIIPDCDVLEMLKFLREWLGEDWEVNIKGTMMSFKSDIEEYYEEFPLKMLLSMYDCDELETTFLMSSILPW